MSERPTPETDEAERMAFAQEYMVPTDFARRLERERDQAREEANRLDGAYEDATNYYARIIELTDERDEARNKMADALQEVDLRNLDFERMKQERDEARGKAERYRLEANALMLKVMEGAK